MSPGAGVAKALSGTTGGHGARPEARRAAYASRRAGKYAVRRAKTAIGAGARVVTPAKILILDEATASIDSTARSERYSRRWRRFAEAHHAEVRLLPIVSTIVEADTILVLHRGRGGGARDLSTIARRRKGATGKCINYS